MVGLVLDAGACVADGRFTVPQQDFRLAELVSTFSFAGLFCLPWVVKALLRLPLNEGTLWSQPLFSLPAPNS